LRNLGLLCLSCGRKSVQLFKIQLLHLQKNKNNMINWQHHIVSNPEILFGKPTIIDTRISVDLILEKLANGDTLQDLLDAYPSI